MANNGSETCPEWKMATVSHYLISDGLSVEKIPGKCSYISKGSENFRIYAP
jgi:hypothetical protein